MGEKMTEYTVEQVTQAYMRLREIRAQKEASFKEVLDPIDAKMVEIENWLLAKMESLGADNIKTKYGTPYKKIQTSVTLADPETFKNFVLQPAADSIGSHLQAMGYAIDANTVEQIRTVIAQMIHWDVAELRVSKAGVKEFMEQHQVLPPGVAVSQFATINVRKS
jgi:hypothetical protein